MKSDSGEIFIFISLVKCWLKSCNKRLTQHCNILNFFKLFCPKEKMLQQRMKWKILSIVQILCSWFAFFKFRNYQRWIQVIAQKILKIAFSNLMQEFHLSSFEMWQNVVPNMDKILKIFATLQATPCVGEWSFWILRTLKVYLRYTVTESRLNAFIYICI